MIAVQVPLRTTTSVPNSNSTGTGKLMPTICRVGQDVEPNVKWFKLLLIMGIKCESKYFKQVGTVLSLYTVQ